MQEGKLTRAQMSQSLLKMIDSFGSYVIYDISTITITEPSSQVAININNFNKDIDNVFVFKNGVIIQEDLDYTISDDNQYIVCVNEQWTPSDDGMVFKFIGVKNVKSQKMILFNKNEETLTTAVSQIEIKLNSLDKTTDTLLVFKNDTLISLNNEYTISDDNKYINKITGSWNIDDNFKFILFKTVIAEQLINTLQIYDNSISEEQLTDALRNLIYNKVDKVTGKGLSQNSYTSSDSELVQTIPSLQTAISDKIDAVANKILSSNDFTDDDKALLDLFSDFKQSLQNKVNKSDFDSSFVGEYSGQASDYSNGWMKFVDNFKICWGYPEKVSTTINGGQAFGEIVFPKAFDTVCLKVLVSDAGPKANSFSCYYYTKTGAMFNTARVITEAYPSEYSPSYIAFGY